MRNRLTRITTRTGDAGDSGLADGTRRRKTDAVFDALGDVDELNTALGGVIAAIEDAAMREALLEVQSRLFDIGGTIATPGAELSLDEDIGALDRLITRHNERLTPLANFVLPGGDPVAALLHQARAVCRRAERAVWRWRDLDDARDANSAVYLNRLSDLLFILARCVNAAAGREEPLWQQREKP